MSDQPFSEEDFDELKDRESLIFELTESPGWQALVATARKRVNTQKLRILSGNLAAEDYMKTAYSIQGAEFVLGLPEEIHGLVSELRRQIAERESQEA